MEAPLDVRDQLLRLVRLQGLVLEVRAAHEVVEGTPARLEEIECRFRERNAEYVAVKERYDALTADQRVRSGELQLLEQQHRKYQSDLMQVQNQREYAAILKEIDAVKGHIAEHEEGILSDMEEIESAQSELAAQEEHIRTERLLVERERVDVESAVDAARRAIADLETERRRIEAELPRGLVSTIGRLEAGRQGVFLSRAEDGICQSCFVRVRPQVFQEIKLASTVHYCSSCKRLLYHEPSLKAASGGTAAGPAAATGLEALNGGAV